jgi:hypothetical protein
MNRYFLSKRFIIFNQINSETKMKGEEQSNLGDAARAAALEKELMRLKSINRKQSVKYNRLKKIFFFTNIFIIILFVMMFSYRMIHWPESNTESKAMVGAVQLPEQIENTQNDTDSIVVTSLQPEVATEDMISFYVPADGILFSVQIGAYTGVDMSPYSLNLLSIKQYSYQDINQLSVGIFQDYNKAVSFRDLMLQIGFNDSFIIATLNGKRIPVQEALAIKSTASTGQTFPTSDAGHADPGASGF